MNFVYKITFVERKKNGLKPYYYIGSKTNSVFENGNIVSSRGLYYGSSEDALYKHLIANNEPLVIEILSEHDDYQTMLESEREAHIDNDVVASSEYFNKSNAMVNTYSDPDYATYKNVETGKIARLPRNHESVSSGEWVGLTKGRVMSDSEKQTRIEYNATHGNAFSGRTHSKESIDKMKKSVEKWRKDNPEYYAEICRAASERMSILSKKPKSEIHKQRIGDKSRGKIVLKNRETGECIKIAKEDRHLYDVDLWVNTYKLAMEAGDIPILTCEHCNKSMQSPSMYSRWHGKNCKMKAFNENQKD